MRYVPGIQPRWEPPLAAPWAPGAAVGRDDVTYRYDAVWMMNRSSLNASLAGRWDVPISSGTAWRWARDSGGSTGSTDTGPTPQAIHAYCYIETSGQPGLTPAQRSARGILTMRSGDDDQGAVWLRHARDRTLTLRCCLQGDFTDIDIGIDDDGEAFAIREGLSVEWQEGLPAEPWPVARHIVGWGYADSRLAGDEAIESGTSVPFTVAENGGWRDVEVPIPDAARRVRIRPIYAPEAGSQSYQQDMALRWVRLTGTVSDPALATAPRPEAYIRDMVGFRADDLAAWEHTPWSSLDTGGGWIGRHSAGSTPTSQTGPAPSNTLPYVHTDVGNADLAPQEARGVLTLRTGDGDPGRAWAEAQRDRVVRLRLCLQGHWGDSGEGLYVEGRASDADAWSAMGHRVYGWAYTAPANAGDLLDDEADLRFRVAATGGWRDVAFDVLPDVRQLRIRPDYAGNPRARHDVAIARIELGYLA